MSRVVVLAREYPQLSQTYIESELRQLTTRGHDASVISVKPAEHGGTDEHHPFVAIPEGDQPGLRAAVTAADPDVVHGHYLRQTPVLFDAARHADVGFTVRGHSYDILGSRWRAALPEHAPMLNSEHCLGVLSFPFTRPILEDAGIREDKIVDCWPVVDFARFHDETPNGDAILNVGACMPKKAHDQFLTAAATIGGGRQWNLYPLGYDLPDITDRNAALDNPVTIHNAVPHRQMRTVYKQHAWLLYTASTEIGTVGWPIAIAEAQAAGVGVCIPRIRPDITTYVGDGAGIVFDHLDELATVLADAPSQAMREKGFAQARRSDIADHIRLLEQRWTPRAGG